MINSVSLDKIRTSVVIKVAGLFIFAVLAVAFLVLPLGASAAGGQSSIARLVGVYTSCGGAVNLLVDNKATPNFMLAPYLDHSVKLSGLSASDFFDATINGQHVTGMFLSKTKRQAVVVINGKALTVTITDSGTTNGTKR